MKQDSPIPAFEKWLKVLKCFNLYKEENRGTSKKG